MKYRIIQKSSLAILVIWMLSLGFHCEHELGSKNSVVSGNAWTAFENGSEEFYPNAWLDGGERLCIGVPYIAQYTAKRPPYTLSFAFTARVDQRTQSITIETMQIEYDNGKMAMISGVGKNGTSHFYLDDRDEVQYLRANLHFVDCVDTKESFWVNINGYYSKDDTKVPYTTRVRIDIIETTYLYPGWVRLMIQNL